MSLHMRFNWALPALCLVVSMLTACSPSANTPEPATLVISGASIWTADPQQPWAEAIASRGDKIIAVGSRADIEPFIDDDTEVIEASGAMLVPGFIDTHVHFAQGGASLSAVQLRNAKTPEEFSRRIADFAKTLRPGEWVLEGNWDHQNWGGELPRKDWLDELTPDNPVWVYRLDGHMAVANSLALKLAGVDADTANIDGGEIVRDADGYPTGVLKDNALQLVDSAVPLPGDELLDQQIESAMHYVAAQGVTTVHDMSGFRMLASYRRLQAAGKMGTRVYSVVPLNEWATLRDEVAEKGIGDNWLRIGGLKGFMDGSLGSHTAAMLEAFTDAPDDKGFLVNTLPDLKRWISDADAAGLQVMVHAIGDSAIRDLLDIYLDVSDEHGPRDRRFRIEHAQHIHPDDLPRFAAQNIIASMQPYHAIDDGRWAEKVIGKERAETTYAFRSLIDSGAHVAFGSDWFVAPAMPLLGIYAAVTRRTLDDANPDGWIPAQKITVEQALRAYTSEGAYSSFEEDVKGTLAPDMLADFVLLDRNLTSIPPEDIRNAKVLRTVIGGKTVYRSE